MKNILKTIEFATLGIIIYKFSQKKPAKKADSRLEKMFNELSKIQADFNR